MTAPQRTARSALHGLSLALLLAVAAGGASAQLNYDSSPEVQAALRRLATDDPAVQRARWGDLAAVAGKPWLNVAPGEVASVWRHPRWVVPGAVMRYHRGFCIAVSCQGTDYLVQYNEHAKQLEFYENGALAYTGRPQPDGAVRLAGAGLVGLLTAETLKFDAASGTLFSDKHELKAGTSAQLHAASRGMTGDAAAAATTATAAAPGGTAPGATAPAAGASQPAGTQADLRAELAAMKAKVDALTQQVEQRQATAGATGPSATAGTSRATGATAGAASPAAGGSTAGAGTAAGTVATAGGIGQAGGTAPTAGTSAAMAPAGASGPSAAPATGSTAAPAAAGTAVAAPTLTPAQAREAERRAQREEQARLAEERRQAAQRAKEEAARGKEEQRLAAQRAKEEEVRAKEEAKAKAREEAQAKVAEAKRAAEEQKAQAEAEVKTAADALPGFSDRVGVAPDIAKAIEATAAIAPGAAAAGKTVVLRRYAALAVHRKIKNRYGEAKDRATREEAEAAALKACNGFQSGCELVISFSGYACASYRAVDPELGDAWGLGFATGLPTSQWHATEEGRKYAGDVTLEYNQAWVCNHLVRTAPALLFAAQREPDKIETVRIGAQQWTTRNLNVATFRNGDRIPVARSAKEWAEATAEGRPMSRFPQDKPGNGKTLGRFYNWFAVADPRGLCPQGFRVPSRADFEALVRTVGARGGQRLKTTSGWNLYSAKDLNGTDEFGFAALPLGGTGTGGDFHGVNGVANIWTSSNADGKYAWMMSLMSHNDKVDIDRYPRTAGESVRCIAE
jgi:uncharacterized protein (TIGR02145 family)